MYTLHTTSWCLQPVPFCSTRMANVEDACQSHLLISGSQERFSVMLEQRQVNSWDICNLYLFMVMVREMLSIFTHQFGLLQTDNQDQIPNSFGTFVYKVLYLLFIGSYQCSVIRIPFPSMFPISIVLVHSIQMLKLYTVGNSWSFLSIFYFSFLFLYRNKFTSPP